MSGLADIGRSRAISGLTRNILEGSQGLLNTRLTMDRMDQDQRSRDIQDRLSNLKLQEAEAQKERDNRLVDIDEIPTKFSAMGLGEVGKSVHGYVKGLGYGEQVTAPDGSVKTFIRKGDIKSALNSYKEVMGTYPDFGKSILWGTYMDANAGLEALQQKVGKAKPEERDAISQQIEQMKAHRDKALRSYKDFTGKAQNDIIKGAGGGLYQRTDTGVEELVPPAERGVPKAGELRKYHAGNKEVTEEWTGSEWRPKSEAPRYKPEGERGAWKPKISDRLAMERAVTDTFANMVLGENDRLLGTKLTPAQVTGKLTKSEKEYKASMSKRAWSIYSANEGAITASEAVAQAMSESPLSTSGPSPSGAPSAPPAGFRDSGRTSGGKKVYISADGKSAWVAP
jgi:hypothetical protein